MNNMWVAQLQNHYGTYGCWENHADMYRLDERLGGKTIEEYWDENPIIKGSVYPRDFRRATAQELKEYDEQRIS